MQEISLDGKWKLYHFPQGERLIQNPMDLDNSELHFIEATVPGNVEIDLMNNGISPDLFFGDNIRLLKPYERYEWWYERQFDTPACIENRRIELIMHGVDCIATYWLNGHMIGRSDNMFIEHKFDITGLLNDSEVNTLVVRLASPIIEAMERDYEPSMAASFTNWEQLWIRKAPHSYGWDIMPRALSAGLWRSVDILIHDDVEIEDLYYYTKSIDGNKAVLGIFYQVRVDDVSDLELEIQGCFNGAPKFEHKQKLTFIAGKMKIEVDDAQLWWPRGYGDANLYEVTARLLKNGEIIAEHRNIIGIRTAELIRTDITSVDRPGEFLFKINGMPILCKGSNWVPADAFHSRDADRYDEMLKLFVDVNCNILRCWGGNVYEDHAFYALCDEYGIMVWQDFAMACACYPQDREFLQKIEEEATSVVKKLRSHPSIILWSGDNECDDVFTGNGMDPTFNKITRDILPQVVRRYDPVRSYLPSSPYHAPEVVARKNNYLMPEQHLWGPRDYFKSRYYRESTAHFASEIGYHGCPNVSSIKKFIDEEHLWPWNDNAQWLTHCSDPIGEDGPYSYRIKLMADQIKELFGIYPDNLDDFAIASQISQAEAKKFFIEMTRLKKWRKTGIIWWNMIDGWPQFSDAVVDYYFGKKLAYYYIKRVQQPVCIMIDELESWHVRVVAGNDSNRDAKGEYKIWDADSGEILLQGVFDVKANENLNLGYIRVSHADQRLFLIEWEINDERYGNHYLLGSPPFCLDEYKGEWLKSIALLPQSFPYIEIGK